jgi:uncharacterized integral membrane protein (TIGR00698 family)
VTTVSRFSLPRLLPGLALAAAVSVASLAIAAAEARLFGHPVIEGLVVAILVGMLLRSAWTPPLSTSAGIRFAAKEVLEVAIVLLGASVDLPLLLRSGPSLAIGIVLLVMLGLAASYSIGRLFGLPRDLAVLVACGNSICGNSAIAAVAPVIGAEQEHVASSIAFTAILGVIVVVGLPLLIGPLSLSHYQYGVMAGLTVYAVPQVLAAAFPVSVLSGQVGTLVKLMRVLMLGPVVLFFALRNRVKPSASRGPNTSVTSRMHASADDRTRRPSFTRFVPWFIIGFMILAALRSGGAIPASVADPMKTLSMWLTVLAMAGLGLGVDLRAIAHVGVRVMATVSASLLVLLALSLALIHLLAIR